MFQYIEREKEIACRQFDIGEYSGTDVEGHAFPNPCRGFFIDVDSNAFMATLLQFREQYSGSASNLDGPTFPGAIPIDEVQPILDPTIRAVVLRSIFNTGIAPGLLTDVPV